MKKQKILYIITCSDTFGGAQKYVTDLAINLPRDKYNITVAYGSQTTNGNNHFARILKDSAINTHILQHLRREICINDFASIKEMRDLIRQEQPDVVHLNSSKAGILGAIAARAERAPHIVFTCHGWPFWEKRNILWRIQIWLVSFVTAMLCHKIICVSTNDARVFGNIFRKKFSVIANANRHIDFVSRQDAMAKLGISMSDNSLSIVSIAELNHNKDLQTAIKAVSLASDKIACQYYIIGNGVLRNDLQTLAKSYGSNNIHFLGYVNNVAKYLKAFDVLLLTSIKEGLPYVLLEAGDAGIQFIASAIGGIPEITTVDDTLCAPGNIKQFANAIIEFKKAPNKAKKRKNDFADMLSQTLNVYSGNY